MALPSDCEDIFGSSASLFLYNAMFDVISSTVRHLNTNQVIRTAYQSKCKNKLLGRGNLLALEHFDSCRRGHAVRNNNVVDVVRTSCPPISRASHSVTARWCWRCVFAARQQAGSAWVVIRVSLKLGRVAAKRRMVAFVFVIRRCTGGVGLFRLFLEFCELLLQH